MNMDKFYTKIALLKMYFLTIMDCYRSINGYEN